MANPMQRRNKNSFLLGVLITVIIMGLITFVLIMKIKSLNNEVKSMKSKQKSFYVAAMDIEPGQELTMDLVRQEQVQTSVIEGIDYEYIYDPVLAGEENEETGKTSEIFKTKIKIAAGTIITKDMLYSEKDAITKDKRIQEYNMISLPSQLEEGTYVDVRLRLATGEDYVVLSKKKVEQANATTVWLKVDEIEILTMDNAIIEAWMLDGSKLYAIEYVEPGLQEKATSTFPISQKTAEYINANPNALGQAIAELNDRYTDGLKAQRNNVINSALNEFESDRGSLVETGTVTEIQNIQKAREEYVQALGIQ